MPKSRTLVAGLLGAAMLVGSAAAETFMISAVAPWTAEGKAYRISPKDVLFQGEFSGVMYFDGGRGELDASRFSCPVRQVVKLESAEYSAAGFCVFNAKQGAVVYADWACEGKQDSCEGTLKIRQGTGHLAGITGNGKMLIRSALSVLELENPEGGRIVKSAEGIAIWPALEISLPGAQASPEASQ